MVEINKSIVKEIEEYAKKNKVPIMQREGIRYLTSYIAKNDIHNVLEIGTAIGYSAIMMAYTKENIHITSIERDEQRYLEALRNVKRLELEDRITLIFNDAFNVSFDDKFDLIFIDAAKAQNIRFFEKFQSNLKDNGTIITDNMKFHGLIDKDEEEIKSRDLRGLVRKVKEYRKFLDNNKEYETEIIDIGDGIAISTKK